MQKNTKYIVCKTFLNIIVYVILGFLLMLSLSSIAQSADHTEDKIKADALAFAYAECEHALAKYYLDLDPEKKELKIKFKEANFLRAQMTYNRDAWYKNEDDKKKLDREIKAANKKLKRCIKYQNIMDAKEDQEKQKAKLGQ